jgi:hypothetical protein
MTYPKSIVYFILALALARGIIYAAVVPPWQAPDEPPQFERARAALTSADWNSTAENGPAWYEAVIRSLFTFGYYDFQDTPRQAYSPDSLLSRYLVLYQEAYGGLYGSRPAYAVIGWPLFLARHQDITLQLYLVRLNTVLMNVGIILLAYLTARTIFPHSPFLILGVPILILFNPQHTHLLSTVNNGNLAELLAAAVLYLLVRGMIDGFSWFKIITILILSIVAMWTKATAYFLPFAIGTVGLFFLWQYRRHWRWLLPGGLILAGAAYFLAPDRLKLLLPDAWSLLQTRGFNLDPIVPQDLFRSFWAMPGWTIFYLHPIWYQILGIGCILALVGLVILTITNGGSILAGQNQTQFQALAVLAVAVIVAIGILLAWNGLTHDIVYRQGRSIYPVAMPISLFLMLGWRQLIPQDWRRVGLLAVTLALFLFDSLVLFQYIIPFFYSRY